MSQYDMYLMHHGVKGMKWGVRKAPEQTGFGSSGRRTPSGKTALGKSTKVAKRFASSTSMKFRNKMSDPEFQRKVATGAKIALAIGVVYATHKIANDPKTLQVGKSLLDGVLSKTGGMKASMLNSTEFKVAKAGLGLAKTGVQKLGSSETRATISGIGALAGTVGILKNQLKGLKEDKVDGDVVDKAVTYTQKMAEIGESLNTIAQGTGGASSTSSSSSSSNSSDTSSTSSTSSTSNASSSKVSATIKGVEPSHKGVDKNSKEYQSLFKGQDADTRSNIKALVKKGYDVDQIREHLKHSGLAKNSSGNGNLMQDSKTGKIVRTNRQLTIKDSKQISDYQKQHPNKSLEDALNDLDLLDKEYAKHSAIKPGWSFNRNAGCRYIF